MMYVVLQRSGIYARIRLVEMARIRSLIVLFCSHKAVLLKYSTLMFSFLIMWSMFAADRLLHALRCNVLISYIVVILVNLSL